MTIGSSFKALQFTISEEIDVKSYFYDDERNILPTPFETNNLTRKEIIVRYGILIALLMLQLGCGSSLPPQTARFYDLSDLTKEAFDNGKTDEARDYAEELLSLAPQFKRDWNYGNAIHQGNSILGRIAVLEDRIENAKKLLLEAGKSPGSPQLDSFGPNMSLAKDLLEKGKREVVLEYFELCRKFWDMGHDRLDTWAKDVESEKIPVFGANLIY